MRRNISGVVTVAVLAIFLFLLFVAITRAQSAEVVARGNMFNPRKLPSRAGLP